MTDFLSIYNLFSDALWLLHTVVPSVKKNHFYFSFSKLQALYLSQKLLIKRNQAPNSIDFIILLVLSSCKEYAKLIFDVRNQKNSGDWKVVWRNFLEFMHSLLCKLQGKQYHILVVCLFFMGGDIGIVKIKVKLSTWFILTQDSILDWLETATQNLNHETPCWLL